MIVKSQQNSFDQTWLQLYKLSLTFSLLSNAGLPEMNPLLELGNGVEDDFQKMLNEWENHMDSLQVSLMGSTMSTLHVVEPEKELITLATKTKF